MMFRSWPGNIDRRGEGDHPEAGNRAVGFADDPAESGRLANRTSGVGASDQGELRRRRPPPPTDPPEDPPGESPSVSWSPTSSPPPWSPIVGISALRAAPIRGPSPRPWQNHVSAEYHVQPVTRRSNRRQSTSSASSPLLIFAAVSAPLAASSSISSLPELRPVKGTRGSAVAGVGACEGRVPGQDWGAVHPAAARSPAAPRARLVRPPRCPPPPVCRRGRESRKAHRRGCRSLRRQVAAGRAGDIVNLFALNHDGESRGGEAEYVSPPGYCSRATLRHGPRSSWRASPPGPASRTRRHVRPGIWP